MQPMPIPETLYDPPEIEYLDGEAHPKVSPKLTHSLVQGALIRIVTDCAAGRGFALPELRLDPGVIDRTKTEFVPDVAYVSRETIKQLSGEAREKPPFSPEIAIEVRSPSDNLPYLARKIARYLRTGSVLVLDVNPAKRQIIAHSAGDVREYRAGEKFEHPAAPWLVFDVNSIFADLDLN